MLATLPPAAPLFLIGFMASGKSTVGRLVAAQMGWSFHDLDRLICDAAGRSVARIFADEGEAGFRRRESDALRTAARASRSVIATGGGAACHEENLQLMLASGRVVALEVSPAEVLRRVGTDDARPLLASPTGGGATADEAREASAAALLAVRLPFYARAHHRVDTHGKSPQQVAEAVLRLIDAGRT